MFRMQDVPFAWQDGQPYSPRYGDIYFSRDSGIAETRHVFLEQNHLARRWAELKDGEMFVIGETGFGTGLNFLCAWQLWEQVSPASARLHFISTERHPLPADALRLSLALWPELAAFADQLMYQYGDLAPGWHRMAFAQGRVMLTLLIGDVNATLPRLGAQIDAWFLDGFAPAKNPEMWSPRVFETIARCSAPGTTFATYTSAGRVRRGLEAVGFRVEKVRGYGRKRDMLRGTYAGTATPRQTSRIAREVIVIGGGLAGSATAYSLAQRSWKTTLIERHPAIAAEASGNHQGILYARISPSPNPLSEFALAGYQHALRVLATRLPQGEDTWRQCGLLQLAFDPKEAKRLEGVRDLGLPESLLRWVERDEASALAGVDVPYPGLHFAGGGWVSPPALCRALLDGPALTVLTGIEATHLRQDGDAWEVLQHGTVVARAPCIVIACAVHTRRFEQTAHLPLRSIRGQVTHLPATATSRRLRAVLCSDGYVAPPRAGLHTLGATYGNLEETVELRAVDHAENLAMLAQLSPELYQALGGDGLQPENLDGRAACRCNVPDYLPLVGLVSPMQPGLYVNTGHGSRGLITALLSAEALAAEICREPAPLPEDLLRAMSPQRFLRKVKRGFPPGNAGA
ncbi:MAG: bifunctional tRNA (5-methylaminomethyl-2-thiouridine)(34)-methyltransferase MnmD/FAD-dependent 5-carboxymethylaminomethyl-2-thiouridine(34) oxidoreductase MnmC [Methylophilaceae bacterium]|nr:bifunctional tRNA (5-methylaminomethyl-2-thiouridine)(34)-methyltransferase MnmD/FAD-dependent 5-carboxymethylaminomethyl-2-thiouridine(34) oxidoreductase MnmC [Methylophilaceae bacterium]